MNTRIMPYLRRGQEWFNDALDLIVHHGRGPEWVTASMKLYMAFQLLAPGDTLRLKTYQNVQLMGLDDEKVAGFLIVFGLVHMAALYVNGKIQRSPTWRGVCCLVGMLVFGFLWYVTKTSPMQTQGLLPALFGPLVFLELIGCRIAGDDRRCLMQQR